MFLLVSLVVCGDLLLILGVSLGVACRFVRCVCLVCVGGA